MGVPWLVAWAESCNRDVCRRGASSHPIGPMVPGTSPSRVVDLQGVRSALASSGRLREGQGAGGSIPPDPMRSRFCVVSRQHSGPRPATIGRQDASAPCERTKGGRPQSRRLERGVDLVHIGAYIRRWLQWAGGGLRASGARVAEPAFGRLRNALDPRLRWTQGFKRICNTTSGRGGNCTRRPDLSSGSDHCLCGTAGVRTAFGDPGTSCPCVSCASRSALRNSGRNRRQRDAVAGAGQSAHEWR